MSTWVNIKQLLKKKFTFIFFCTKPLQSDVYFKLHILVKTGHILWTQQARVVSDSHTGQHRDRVVVEQLFSDFSVDQNCSEGLLKQVAA